MRGHRDRLENDYIKPEVEKLLVHKTSILEVGIREKWLQINVEYDSFEAGRTLRVQERTDCEM